MNVDVTGDYMNKELWDLYLKVVHGSGIENIKAWSKFELTMSQLKILMILFHNENMTIGQLAEHLSVSLPNMTGIIDRLVQQDIVKRVHSEKDRRVVLIKLTDKAKSMFQELNESSYEQFKRIEQNLSENEIQMVKLGLRILADGMARTWTNT